MDHAESKNPTLEGRDILFQCGKCGRSLSIDGRGAGLNIRCPQCDSELEVPIPEGFDLAELDKELDADVTVLVKGSRFMKMERVVAHCADTTEERTH